MTDVSRSGEADPSVCYRHPDRQSWILCQRCGRTICPECQILAPVGVQCPECVREAGGSVKWAPTGGSRLTQQSSAAASFRRRPAWLQSVLRLVRPDSGTPIVTYSVLGLTVFVSIVGIFVPALWNALIASPFQPVWEIWRFFTSMFVQPSLLNLVLNVVFFLLIGPSVERMLGRARFATVLLAGAAVGASAMLLAGGPGYGLSGAMFGMFAAYFVIMRSQGAPTTQFLVIIGLNLVLTVLFGAQFLPMLIGGLIGGGGAAALFFFHRDRRNSRPVTPYWQIGAGVALFVVIAILRTSIAG